MALSGNESPENGHKKPAYAELKFVPSSTPIAVSSTLKSTLMSALKLGEQVANIPGRALVSVLPDDPGEDGRKSRDIRGADIRDSRHWWVRG